MSKKYVNRPYHCGINLRRN